MLNSDLTGAAIITAAFAVILIAAEVWSRLLRGKPEHTRKLVHLGGGIIGLALPWLIDSPLVVFVLTASLSALFVIGEKTGLLKSLHGVERKSRGSEYYPLAIWLVFVIAAERPWLYVSAVLVLAVADAFAALIGTRYGKLRYQVEDEYKSIEGSLVFFVLSVLIVLVPALTMTTLPVPVAILSALLVAMLVTMFEAVSLRGTDNLFVPVAVVYVLQKITTKSVEHILMQNISLIAIVAIVMLLAWRIEWFNAGGALTVTLFVFAAWSLGPRFRWAIPVFIGLFALALVRMFALRRGERRRLKVTAVSRALIVPFVFLLAANMTTQFDRFYGPYLAACAAVFAFVAWTRGNAWRALAVGALAAAALVIPMRFLYNAALPALAAIVIVVALMTLANARLGDPREWTAASFLFALSAGAAILALQELGVVSPWSSTTPVAPSIVTTSSLFTSDVSPRMPTMVGMPISRATMAEWERIEPRSMSSPEIDG
jgi:dolichol kinase